jgi:hypothetical protein
MATYIRRRESIVAVSGVAVAWPLAAPAQQPSSDHRGPGHGDAFDLGPMLHPREVTRWALVWSQDLRDVAGNVAGLSAQSTDSLLASDSKCCAK